MIYFAQAEGTDLVKIGFTGGDPTKRLSELQTGCPHRLVLLASIPGAEQDEARWHRDFASDRLNGEWFKLTPRLMVRMITAVTGTTVALQDRIDALEDAIVHIEHYLAPLGFKIADEKPATTSLRRSPSYLPGDYQLWLIEGEASSDSASGVCAFYVITESWAHLPDPCAAFKTIGPSNRHLSAVNRVAPHWGVNPAVDDIGAIFDQRIGRAVSLDLVSQEQS